MNPLKPPVTLLVKLGSIAVHTSEMDDYNYDHRLSQWGFDRATVQALLADAEVREWIEAMHKLAFIPVKR